MAGSATSKASEFLLKGRSFSRSTLVVTPSIVALSPPLGGLMRNQEWGVQLENRKLFEKSKLATGGVFDFRVLPLHLP